MQKKASLMDGQHRLGGIGVYTKETSAMLNVPFLAFHCLDEELSWIATQLIIDPKSSFYKGTLIGKRTKEKHITLQNVYNFLLLLINNTKIAELPK